MYSLLERNQTRHAKKLQSLMENNSVNSYKKPPKKFWKIFIELKYRDSCSTKILKSRYVQYPKIKTAISKRPQNDLRMT